jgi:hypothetical protein
MADGDTVSLIPGVRVVRRSAGHLQVESAAVDLGWNPPAGRVAGTAVLWDEAVWEVRGRELVGQGWRWQLEPWPEGEPVRCSFTLDAEHLQFLLGDRRQQASDVGRRLMTLPLLPLMGLAPRTLQMRWRDAWGYPAAHATAVSAFIELCIGSFASIRMYQQLFGGLYGGGGSLGSFFLNWYMVGPILFAEAVVRLRMVAADGDPIGSIIGSPLGLLDRERAAPPPGRVAPRCVSLDDGGEGALLLEGLEFRSDWFVGGVLPYRGRQWRLDQIERFGRGWRYTFSGAADAAADLSLRPELVGQHDPPKARDGGPRLASAILITVAAMFLPAELQRRWATIMRTSPMLFTGVGAGIELLGNLTVLSDPTLGPLSTVIAVAFAADGGARLVLALIRGAPVGSVVGLWLGRLVEPAIDRIEGR